VQVGNRLPHVPATLQFPVDAEPRWRPLVRSRLGPGDVVIPLIELRDETGLREGDSPRERDQQPVPPDALQTAGHVD
jgi:hypothetical protein